MSDKTAVNTYAKLRLETAAMFGFGQATLTAAQAMRVDLVTALRLGLDDLSGKLAGGERVDLGKLLEASEALLKFLPVNMITPCAPPPSEGGPVTEAHRELARLLAIDPETGEDTRVPTLEARVRDLEDENRALHEQLNAQPSSSPQPQSHPAVENVVALHRRADPPAHYTPPRNEPWRQYSGGS